MIRRQFPENLISLFLKNQVFRGNLISRAHKNPIFRGNIILVIRHKFAKFVKFSFKKNYPQYVSPSNYYAQGTYATTPKYKPVSLSKDKSYAALLFTRFYFSSFLSTNSL